MLCTKDNALNASYNILKKLVYIYDVNPLDQATSKKLEGKGEHGASSVEGNKPEARVKYGVPLTEEHERWTGLAFFNSKE